MRLLLCCLFAMAIAPAAEWKVDHATIAGPSLKRLREILDAAGLRTEYGGEHSSRQTEMAILSFPDGSYLELIAWVDASAPHPGQSWAKFMDQQGGPCAWAVAVDDIGRETARLKSTGIAVTEPAAGGRTRTDGVRLEWKTAGAGPGDRGALLPFLIQDVTPRERRVYPAGKPTTPEYGGISKIVIAVRDLRSAIDLYRKAYSLPAPKQQKDAHLGATLAWFPGTPVILATPLNSKTWLAGRLEKFGEAPCAFLLKDTGHPRSGNTIWFDRMVSWFDVEGIRLGAE